MVRRGDATTEQLDLFGPAEAGAGEGSEPPVRRRVGPAPVSEEVLALGRALPRGVHLGGSTWSFPGWVGLVYDRKASPTVLARDGLAAYARHPLLRAAGIDRTHYQPLAAEEFAAYAAQVPEGFRFVVKAHEDLTLWRFPDRPRYGARRGLGNPLFLDPAYAAERVVAPWVEGLGEKAGALVFEFAPQDLGDPRYFARDLRDFLLALPRGPAYAVELRNRELLTADYAAALAEAGASHCFNVYPRMPDLAAQARVVPPAGGPATVVRWLLAADMTYEEAGARYKPFDRIVREDPAARRAIAGLVREALAAGRPALVTVNNNAEGSAPLSIVELAKEIVRDRSSPE